MERNTKIFKAIFYVLYAVLCLCNYCRVEALNICDFYGRGWFPNDTAFVYVPVYMYFLVNKIKYYQRSYVVVRIDKKSDILCSEMYENIFLAIEFSVVTNLIRFLCMQIFYKGSYGMAECLYYYVATILAQALAWCFMGMLCIIVYIISNKVVFSYIVTVIIMAILFKAHSDLFSFADYFIDINARMYLNTNEMNYKEIIYLLMSSAGINAVMYLFSFVLTVNKKIYGDDSRNESI